MGKWEQKHRTEWMAKGLCNVCGGKKVEGRIRCQRCIDRNNAAKLRQYHKLKHDLTICPRCFKKRDQATRMCSKCHKAALIRSRKNTPALREKNRGINCVRCNYPLHHEMDKGKITCLSCREHNTKPMIRRRT